MSAPAIEFTGVSRWYGDTVSLADVSFTADGGVVGLLGHNGAGKSTTLKLCAGFSTPSTGTVRIYGDNPRRHPDVYRRIGIVPDHSPPWPFLTGREVVELSARLHKVADYREAAARAIATVELEGAAERRVAGFSHGMSRRLSVLLAAFAEPQLLLLDEPFDGVDPLGVDVALELVAEARARGAAVLVSTHLLPLAVQACEEAVVLRAGVVVAAAPTTELGGEVDEGRAARGVAVGGGQV